jgi:hypothetical protein
MKQAATVGPVHSLMHSYDLLSEIRALCSQLSFTVAFFWVEGRQQERHGKEDYFGHLNDLCDNLAKAYWNQTLDSPSMEVVRVNDTTWGFGYEGVWPGQFNHTDFYEYTFGSKVSIPYWQDRRHPMPSTGWIQVDWHVLGKTFRLWPRGKRQCLIKHLAQFSAAGCVMFRRDEWSHDRCPRSDCVNEDCAHVLLCPSASACTQWSVSLATFRDKLQQYQTQPDIERVLMAKLHAWNHTANLSFGPDLDPSVRLALLSQDTIGWKNLIYGLMSGFWQDSQKTWLMRMQT